MKTSRKNLGFLSIALIASWLVPAPAHALVAAAADAIECTLASDYATPGRAQLGTSDRQSSVTKHRYSASPERRYICVMDVVCQSRTESIDRSEPVHTVAVCAEREGTCPSIRDCLENSGLEPAVPSQAAPEGRVPRYGGSSSGGDPRRSRGPGSLKIFKKN